MTRGGLRRRSRFATVAERLGTLTRPAGDVEPAALLLDELVRGDRLDRVLGVIETQGIGPQLLTNLRRWIAARGDHPPAGVERLAARLETVVAERRSYLSELDRYLRSYARRARALGIEFLVIKGMAVAPLYPSESPRWMSDVDLLIRDDSSWSAIDLFEEVGFFVPRVRLNVAHDDVRVSGIADVLDRDRSMDYPFDLHLGAFPACGDELLSCDVWERARPEGRDGSDAILRFPSREDSLLILSSHVSRHGTMKLRDYSDVFALVGSGGDFDWDYVERHADRNLLDTYLDGLLAGAERVYGVDVSGGERSRTRVRSTRRRVLARIGDEDPDFEFGRWQFFAARVLQAEFLFRHERRRAGALVALWRSLVALWFLVKDGRPYRLWRGRELKVLGRERAVLAPLAARRDGRRWGEVDIDLDAAAALAARTDVDAVLLVGALVWRLGRPEELVLTRRGLWAQSTYGGDIEPSERARLEAVASLVVEDLVCAGAASASLRDSTESRATTGDD